MIPRQTAPPDETAMDPGALILCMPPAFSTGTAINSGEDFFCDIRIHHSDNSDNSDPGMSSAASCKGGLRVFCNSTPWQAPRTLSLFFTSPLQTHSAQFFITGKNAAGEEALRRQDAARRQAFSEALELKFSFKALWGKLFS